MRDRVHPEVFDLYMKHLREQQILVAEAQGKSWCELDDADARYILSQARKRTEIECFKNNLEICDMLRGR